MYRKGSSYQQWLTVLLVGLVLQVKARPQNPLELFGVGAISVISSAADVLQSGGAVRKEVGIELPFLKMHSKGEAGIGNAMRPSTDVDFDDEQNRRRRRKRSNALDNEKDIVEASAHEAKHRDKRTPCFNRPGATTTATTAATGLDVDDAEQRRRRNAAQRQKRAKPTKRTPSTASSSRRRRRRATAAEDFEEAVGGDTNDAASGITQKLKEHAQKIGASVRNIWDAFVTSMQNAVQKVRKTFSGDNENGPQSAADMTESNKEHI